MKQIIFLLFGWTLSFNACAQSAATDAINRDNMKANLNNLEVATLGGGCFWCVEAVYQQFKGVEKVVSGYSGGHVKNPSYEQVVGKKTGHAEVTQVYFDPNVITFEEILDIFWTGHDPTTKNRQGNDDGPQYRSIILYHDDVQKAVAEKSIKEVASKVWDNPIVTEVEPFEVFYEAEKYHQEFYFNNPNYGYCRVIINPKLNKVRAKFADKLKEIE